MLKISNKAIEDLQNDLGPHLEDLAFDHLSRLLYSTDASIYQMIPIGIAWPRNNDEVAAAVEVAREHGIPILPRGGGSSLAGQAVNHALILDFSRYMDAVLDIDPAGRQVRVQPGMVLGQLNRELAAHGLMFGPDPASADRATVGGVIGNNATGAHSILHGMSHDHLLAADVILADGSQTRLDAAGSAELKQMATRSDRRSEIYNRIQDLLVSSGPEILKRFPRTFRNVAGYNLKPILEADSFNPAWLMAGSEGTLAIMTSATLNLVQKPEHCHLYLVHFDHLERALQVVPEILQTNPSAVELIDRMLLDLARANPAYRHLLAPVQGNPEGVLLVEYQGSDPRPLEGKETALSQFGTTLSLPDKTDQDKIWKARKVGLGILQSSRGDSKPTTFIEDAAVPVEHLADYALGIKEFAREIGVGQIAFYAHASAGCLHIRPMVNLKSKQGLRQMRQLAEKSLGLVLEFGGTTSGEHGEGIARGEFMPLLFGPDLTRTFQEVKNIFDPDNLLNPGKIIHPPAMDTSNYLRYGSSYHASYAPESTRLSFDEEMGFDRAVEMCNGAGVCRQMEGGVMCPTFQATRDEKHSTRGRANALRAAISGKLGENGLTSREVYEVLDLCLSCQACLNECPSTVDMSKLKAEFLHQYYQEHGIPLRNRFFANLELISQLSRPAAPIINFLLSSPAGELVSLLGMDPRRSFPEFQRETFTRWYKNQHQNQKPAEVSDVVLFYDTYLEYNYPWIGQAAVFILEQAGINPIILRDKSDSGRPAFSKGLLDKASRLAKKNLDLLLPYAREGIPIVGCEPSDVVMLTKEYRDLRPGPESDLVAGVSRMLEDYLLEEINAGRVQFSFDHKPRKVLYHGHCQQKANFGTDATLGLLRAIPSCSVEEINAGCCGMAGAFGYEKEHYQLSIEIAEMKLAPAVRAVDPETIIAASGTSCREQITHTTGRKALHPLEVFSTALTEKQ